MLLNVVIYARVSTDDKDQDPERQVLKCKQYCELHNHNVLATITENCSGDSDPFIRSGASKIMSYELEGIVIFSMDRLSRQHPIKVIRLLNDLKDRGIKVLSITEPAFNMENEFSDILLYIIGWFNNYFLIKLKRDIKAGLERARKQGKVLGRPKSKFNKYRGYQLLFVEKRSQRYVSQDLGVSLATINRFKKDVEKDKQSFINNLKIQ